MTNRVLKQAFWTVLLLAVGVASRCIPHPAGFTALISVALVAGLVLPGPVALIVPVGAAFLGDLVLGTHDLMWIVYLSLLPMIWVGMFQPRFKSTWLGWGTLGFLASAFFFFTTNFAVWMFEPLYPHTAQGLSDCFIAALPFFHMTVAGTWVYLAGFEVARRFWPVANTAEVLN